MFVESLHNMYTSNSFQSVITVIVVFIVSLVLLMGYIQKAKNLKSEKLLQNNFL